MSRSLRVIIMVCIAVFILTGCKDMKEVDRITFPVVLGIDWDEENSRIKICAQVSTLSSQSGGESPSGTKYSVLEGEGKTLKEAMDNIIDHAQQYISWKQLIAVVFTDKMAKRGIIRELDVLSRNEQIHLNSYLIITTNSLRDLLGTSPVIETGLPTAIVGVGLISEQSTHSKAVTMKDFIAASLNNEIEPVLPQIAIYRKENAHKDAKNELDYRGLGVFKQDRLVGWLNEKETIALLFVSGIQNQGSFTLLQTENNGEGEITVSEHTTKTKYIPYIKNKAIGMLLTISAEYDIYSYISTQKIDISEVDKINNMVAAHIKKQVEALIHKAQHELNSDIFGFGGKIYRKYPKYWQENKERWPEIFPEIDVIVEVEAKLRDTGELTNSFKYQQEKD